MGVYVNTEKLIEMEMLEACELIESVPFDSYNNLASTLYYYAKNVEDGYDYNYNFERYIEVVRGELAKRRIKQRPSKN